jgi:RNA polymerase sigma factor (sigma-70 family)
MRRSDSDLINTPEHQLDRLSQDELLRLVVICRDKHTGRARAAWTNLITLDIDRVRGIAATFRLREYPGVRVARDDVEDVTQKAYIRLLKMLGTFRGTTEGEYRAAMRTCIGRECQDHLRDVMKREMREAGSVDEVVTDKEGKGRLKFDPEIAKKEQERIDDQEARERQLELQRKVRDAIESLDGNRRRVLELDLERCPTAQIANELSTSEANVYQLRRRALQQLRKILDGDAEL